MSFLEQQPSVQSVRLVRTRIVAADRFTIAAEIDFDADGGVWTSNSNVPGWQIETGVPRVLRLTPAPGNAAGGAGGR